MPHLDRLFDYEVPQALAAAALPGARVRVRLAGRLVDGFIIERAATSERDLQPLRSVHGPAVLTPAIAALCRAVADRYAGTLADVLRSAVPPRHARAERAAAVAAGGVEAGRGAPAPPPGVPVPSPATAAAWARYAGGTQLLERIGGADPVRALVVTGPAEATEQRLAELVRAVRDRGAGVLIVAADAAEVRRIADGLVTHAGLCVARLLAEDGPEVRYRTFLSVLDGRAQVVVGTRTAVFAPVRDLAAIIIWDDADEAHAEPHSPGWHAREVAALRSAAEGISLVLAGPSASLEGARMAATGWLAPVALPRAVLRAAMPRVQVAVDLTRGDPARATDRIPSAALEVLRAGVAQGPVLVSVPRAGYLPALACQQCRELARCPACSRVLRAEGPDRRPTCLGHGPLDGWLCAVCGDSRVRAVVVGVRRTAEEFGRALPGVPVLMSSGSSPTRSLGAHRGLVVATPGTEPDPGQHLYAALVILDVAAALSRPGLRVAEEVLRRWFLAAALVRPATQGGRVLVVGDADVREVQALVRWDPRGYALRELDERRGLALPPAVRVAQLSGPALETAALADAVCEQLGDAVLRRSGPLSVRSTDPGPGGEPQDQEVVWLLAVSLADGPRLSAALQAQQSLRSARRAPVVTVRMDPVRLR
jgi:primosomal protein N' (replication factor Y)